MSKIQFINEFPADRTFTYDERIALLRARKVEQTAEKARAGGADEDDYGLIEQDEFHYKLTRYMRSRIGGIYLFFHVITWCRGA